MESESAMTVSHLLRLNNEMKRDFERYKMVSEGRISDLEQQVLSQSEYIDNLTSLIVELWCLSPRTLESWTSYEPAFNLIAKSTTCLLTKLRRHRWRRIQFFRCKRERFHNRFRRRRARRRNRRRRNSRNNWWGKQRIQLKRSLTTWY